MFYLYRLILDILTPFVKVEDVEDENSFLIHASSVGEVNASIPFLNELKRRFPESTIYLSVFTPTGFRRAVAIKNGVFNPLKFPLDNPVRLKELFDRIKPLSVILIETELWPNLLYEAIKRGIPIFMVNARISQKHWPRYKLMRRYFRPFLSHINLVLAQNGSDAERFIKLGVPSERIKIIGSLKYDVPEPGKKFKKEELGFKPDDIVIIFGSLRSKEDDGVIEVISKLKGKARFVLAPRHLIRVKFLKEKLKKKNIPFVLRSESKIVDNQKVLILDTLGELSSIYYAGDIAFVGGTLAPYGGHSLIEPALASLPVLFGPHTFHTEDVAEGLIESGGGIRVHSKEDLFKTLIELIENPEKRISMGERARNFVLKRRGNAKKMVDEISAFLELSQKVPSRHQP